MRMVVKVCVVTALGTAAYYELSVRSTVLLLPNTDGRANRVKKHSRFIRLCPL